MTDTTQVRFDQLNLLAPVLQAINEMGYITPTPIQSQAIPSLLAGKDVLGEAQTGTGKTAAFGLPLLSRLDADLKQPQMLVVCPTRELAIQVAEALTDFAKHIRGLFVATVYGGQSYTPQLRDLARGPQIVVGTPGRMMDHIKKGRLKLDNLKACVLDEADEMLNMGFLEDIEWILNQIPDQTQMAFFSATMPAPIKKITNQFLTDPIHVKIAVQKSDKPKITQKSWTVGRIGKTVGLERIAEVVDYDAMIVFVRTRNDTLVLAEHLVSKGFKASALNGDMQQQDRERIVEQLKNGRINILIATDVVARGLDVPRITHVINYDLPHDSESYVHRIGRTGRAGREGEAILFASHREVRSLSRLERITEGKIEVFDMPTAEQLGQARIERTQAALVKAMEVNDLANFQAIVSQMAEQSNTTPLELAAALLFDRQIALPFHPKADPVEREFAARSDRGGRDRNDRFDRNDRSERAPRERSERPRRDNGEFDTYRFNVGRTHGVRPGDIVGAVANEIKIDSNDIGQIRLFDGFTHVDLPKNMPKPAFEKLQQVLIRKHKISPSLVTAEQAAAADSQREERAPRSDRNDRAPREFQPRRRNERNNDRGDKKPVRSFKASGEGRSRPSFEG
ncbi:DEAD/DEAH box helicase [Pseudoalteromonas tunicata]|jgi:ATP-dependent RNA helicase DeaD|uniref:DEAD-box ATP-dependent RNA helicase RhpA n=1 Tax=Pseudoalteromonas tunicata D2 TaxID=87626 RepID=A4C3X3_9GAMM|nr:DEAD/DEAH box helicase [Pseudoalteromonas tunicata]ATC97260.1 ATP-dependent RNA helicase DeaD [Pseudoalteromonas tunicata]AXT33342.1 ATP-dependent helicase [Pseudoalteromonas tunicata]EAR30255.1 RNA helicase DeaD [Pseudoalteromonas tunicata D2]MDP4984173.1 DEAD/DEAH box helicase [Pseudoalteromonas tunicata]MDP5214438.1 DEAD/DEAH box helicase [Pseudoalteromonas tunicata]